ncbi:unnamed protein product [Darwinula stevensoni]|uniref:SRA1/Sec31 domain-containing protein n=1 Tax=Darwinula stevensoni TaxID=69355 RepID=A0A7R8XBB3_9CRUS|nr:unnamed protein product [Darwinula stevensoni]CAG0891079.1 unnamed protein product [Darwinula stevensoni]
MAAPLRPGNHERAWNDPPVFSHETSAALQSRPRTSIHHRLQQQKYIPYPDSAQAKSSEPKDPTEPINYDKCPGPPPPPVGGLIPLVQKSPACETPESPPDNVDFKSEERRDFVIRKLRECARDCYDTMSEDTKDDVRRRIEALFDMWKEEKLEDQLMQGLYSLAKAIDEKAYEKADKMQQNLTADFGKSCSSWMPAIRTIIRSHI